MKWLAGWDFPSRTSPVLPTFVAQLIFAMLITTMMIVIRMAIDMIMPGAGALSLLYPAVMIATLFGRWLSGLITLVIAMSYTINFVLPVNGAWALANASDYSRLAVNFVVLIVTIILLEIFRDAVVRANGERDRQIEKGKLLLRELDHRVKNNFMAVSSLLELQRQRSADAVVRDELDSAISRVQGIATAHRFLYRHDSPSDETDMLVYLGELCAALNMALLRSDRVKMRCWVDPVTVHRDRAISIGLVVNELVTNAARHAFPDDSKGTITVSLQKTDKGLMLIVEDDGCGIQAPPRDGSLGRRLIAAFVAQADGELTTDSSSAGTRCTVVLR